MGTGALLGIGIAVVFFGGGAKFPFSQNSIQPILVLYLPKLYTKQKIQEKQLKKRLGPLPPLVTPMTLGALCVIFSSRFKVFKA